MSLGGAAHHSVPVRSSAGDYAVVVGPGVLGSLPELLSRHAPAHRYAIISDDRVAPLHAEPMLRVCRDAGVDVSLFSFPHGEASKTRKQWAILTDSLLDAGFGRDSAVIAVGGGVTGDLAGFVAATFQRGVPVVQVPTSLVAMIDASVGGKTGVDVRAGKNLVGAFHAPKLVVADTTTVATLDREARAEGLVEAVKHGAILDAEYYDRLAEDASKLLDGEEEAVLRAVVPSVRLKADVVSRDEREGGLREILNFGHTIGHALEAAADYGVGHGTAVAAGMILEARLGEGLGVTEAGTAASLASRLGLLGMGAVPRVSGGMEAVLAYLAADKKARGGRPRYVLLERIGAVRAGAGWSHEVPEEDVRALLAEALPAP